jgi:hypothetical protein
MLLLANDRLGSLPSRGVDEQLFHRLHGDAVSAHHEPDQWIFQDICNRQIIMGHRFSPAEQEFDVAQFFSNAMSKDGRKKGDR